MALFSVPSNTTWRELLLISFCTHCFNFFKPPSVQAIASLFVEPADPRCRIWRGQWQAPDMMSDNRTSPSLITREETVAESERDPRGSQSSRVCHSHWRSPPWRYQFSRASQENYQTGIISPLKMLWQRRRSDGNPIGSVQFCLPFFFGF